MHKFLGKLIDLVTFHWFDICIVCAIGWHEWDDWERDVDEYHHDFEYRYCDWCGKTEYRDVDWSRFDHGE